MKTLTRTIVITIAIIALHIVLWAVIFRSSPTTGQTPTASDGAKDTPKENVQPSAVQEKAVSANDSRAVIEAKPSNSSSSSKPSQPPVAAPAPTGYAPSLAAHFNPNVYRRNLVKLPNSLSKLVANCRSGVVIDLETHTILWEKEANKVYPIASLTKLMTSVLLMEKIETDSRASLQTQYEITRDDVQRIRKQRIKGMYFAEGETFTLDEYLKCMIICSANDAAIVATRYIGNGDYDAGLQLINQRAKQMGLTRMKFFNPNGLPIDSKENGRIENTGTALELAFLSEQAMQYPAIMKWAATSKDTIRESTKPFDLNSTNRLLRERCDGITGLKTGYTDTAGYCISLTATRKNHRMLVMVMGVKPPQVDFGRQRNVIAKALLEWAYSLTVR